MITINYVGNVLVVGVGVTVGFEVDVVVLVTNVVLAGRVVALVVVLVTNEVVGLGVTVLVFVAVFVTVDGVSVVVTVFVTTCAIAPPHTRARAKTPRKAKDNFILIFFLLV